MSKNTITFTLIVLIMGFGRWLYAVDLLNVWKIVIAVVVAVVIGTILEFTAGQESR